MSANHKISVGLALTIILTMAGAIFFAGQLTNKVSNLEELKPKVEIMQVDISQIKTDVAVIKNAVGIKLMVRNGQP